MIDIHVSQKQQAVPNKSIMVPSAKNVMKKGCIANFARQHSAGESAPYFSHKVGKRPDWGGNKFPPFSYIFVF